MRKTALFAHHSDCLLTRQRVHFINLHTAKNQNECCAQECALVHKEGHNQKIILNHHKSLKRLYKRQVVCEGQEEEIFPSLVCWSLKMIFENPTEN